MSGIFGSQSAYGGGLFDNTISLGFGAIEQAAAGIGQIEGRLQAYDDGVFAVEETMLDGPLQAYRDGSMGQYEQAAAGIGQRWTRDAGEKWLGGLGMLAAQCKTVAAFNTCDNQQYAAAQQDCYAMRDAGSYAPYANFNECLDETYSTRLTDNCAKYCPTSVQAKKLASMMPGDPCSAKNVVEFVQAVLGVSVDGVFGKGSRDALIKSGQTYHDIAEGCSGSCPTSTSGSLTAAQCGGEEKTPPLPCAPGQVLKNGVCVTPKAPPPPGCRSGYRMIAGKCEIIPVEPPPEKKKGYTMWIVGGLVGAAALTGVYFATRKKAA